MKNAKIMQFSVAVLAIAGGVLAFKAKTFGSCGVILLRLRHQLRVR